MGVRGELAPEHVREALHRRVHVVRGGRGEPAFACVVLFGQ